MDATPDDVRRIERGQRVQERYWVAERIAWGTMALTVLAAMAGVFGDGPLAGVERAAPDGSLRVSFQRFQRADATSRIGFTASAAAARDGRVVLCLDRDFLGEWRVERFEPRPEAESARDGGVCYALRTGTASGADAPEIGLWVAPRAAAFPAAGRVSVEGRASVDLGAWVWP